MHWCIHDELKQKCYWITKSKYYSKVHNLSSWKTMEFNALLLQELITGYFIRFYLQGRARFGTIKEHYFRAFCGLGRDRNKQELATTANTLGKYRLFNSLDCSTVCNHHLVTCIQIDGLEQERRNSSALAMELRLSCTNPSISCRVLKGVVLSEAIMDNMAS